MKSTGTRSPIEARLRALAEKADRRVDGVPFVSLDPDTVRLLADVVEKARAAVTALAVVVQSNYGEQGTMADMYRPIISDAHAAFSSLDRHTAEVGE